MKAYEIKLVKTKIGFVSVKITTSNDSYIFSKQFYFNDMSLYESCFMILLNQQNSTIGWVKISQGGITGTVVDPLLVAKYAIDSLAKGVILCHNHPSGNLNPSKQDDILTEKIKAGLTMFDIKLLDHIILTDESYYSYADEGKI